MKKLTLRQLCILGMLVALTIVFGFFATWRIGASIKISLKFSSVYVAAVLFGPIIGGIVGMASDIASFIANPAAGFIPLITVAEFVIGAVYGLFFKNIEFTKPHIPRVLICCAFQALIVDMLVKTFAISYSFGTGFGAMLLQRLPAVGINFLIQFTVIAVLNIYMEKFKKYCYR